MTRSLTGCAVLAALAALAIPGAASGASVQFGGHPLNVHVGDRGELQAYRDGEPSGIFYPPLDTQGDAGLFLAFPGETTPTVYGFHVTSSNSGITEYTPLNQGQGPVNGSGTAAMPFTQVTSFNAGGLAEIAQTTYYVNGEERFRVQWDVRNVSGGPLKFKAMAAADFFFDGSDRGTGIFTEGPPRFVGGTNADTGRSGGFVEVLPDSPWSTYQALEFGDDPTQVWGKINGAASSFSPTFDGTVIGEQVDNAGAVEWDQYAGSTALDNNQTASFAVYVRTALPANLQLEPSNGGSPRGVPLNITATARDTSGMPFAGKTLRYQITGVNPGDGVLSLNAAGQATITDPGTVAGADTVVAFVDFNNNGARETAEPQASALATFVDTVSPRCTVRVTGDRPGGGGAGKPLVITVNCNETARVTVGTTLRPPARAGSSGRVTRPRVIRLRKVTRVLTPGKRFAFKLRLPRKVARKYAGQKLRAVTTVTAKDPSGNVKRTKKRHTIRVRRLPSR